MVAAFPPGFATITILVIGATLENQRRTSDTGLEAVGTSTSNRIEVSAGHPPIVWKSRVDRRDSLLRNLDVDALVGLELGPLDKPIVPRVAGRQIYYADYASRDVLRQKSKSDPCVDVDSIVEIDFIASPLPETLPVQFDYAIASHVIEHAPDMIGWVNTIMGWLKPSGHLVLAVPDKRYCFDVLRPLSTIDQLAAAYRDRRPRPSFSQVFEGFALACQFGPREAWDDEKPGPFMFSREAALALAGRSQDEHIDCHCWVFSYDAFLSLIDDARDLGMLKAQIVWSAPPVRYANEFHVAFARV